MTHKIEFYLYYSKDIYKKCFLVTLYLKWY